MTNDPLGLGLTNTLDAKVIASPETCVDWDWDAVRTNVVYFFLVWWLPHSGLARKGVKQALGLWNHPLDRPIFAIFAPFTWLITMHNWIPVSNCAKFDLFALDPWKWVVSGTVFTLWSIEVLGLFYMLPSHVFGTDRHTWKDDHKPSHDLILTFPYGLVRHPAAAAFLWFYWLAIPSYTVNHLFLASLWTVFIVVGTLAFEEGGLRNEEFPTVYDKYASRVNAFYPSIWSVKRALGLLSEKDRKIE